MSSLADALQTQLEALRKANKEPLRDRLKHRLEKLSEEAAKLSDDINAKTAEIEAVTAIISEFQTDLKKREAALEDARTALLAVEREVSTIRERQILKGD